jgi:aspartate aminotransferase/aminotransferase
MTSADWLASRLTGFDSSGIRRIFDLAAGMTSPINLSIGQPDFDVPDAVKQAAIEAIQKGRNGYSQTQGIPALREALLAQIQAQYGTHEDRSLLITSGTSGALVLAMLAMVNPGDEVIFFDPYFVMYPALIRLAGGVPVAIDTYPDFRIDPAQVAERITPRTKLILINSPSNPTGVVAGANELKQLAELAWQHNLALISDEIYRGFVYDETFVSPVQYYPETLVIDGFSKSHGMTGWRVGWAHGPQSIIEAMGRLQQFTFVCAPQPAQWAGVAALHRNMNEYCLQYKRKRDRVIEGLRDHYQLIAPGGAFYVFPKVPWGTSQQFVEAAIANQLLVIPGNVFSRRDSHFRISYAASDHMIDRGIEVLRRMAIEGPP